MYLGNGSVGTQIIVRPDNTIIMEDFEIEKPGCGEVLIETVSTLISAGTELGTQEQERTDSFVPGYSNAGTIIALGQMLVTMLLVTVFFRLVDMLHMLQSVRLRSL